MNGGIWDKGGTIMEGRGRHLCCMQSCFRWAFSWKTIHVLGEADREGSGYTDDFGAPLRMLFLKELLVSANALFLHLLKDAFRYDRLHLLQLRNYEVLHADCASFSL